MCLFVIRCFAVLAEIRARMVLVFYLFAYCFFQYVSFPLSRMDSSFCGNSYRLQPEMKLRIILQMLRCNNFSEPIA